MLYIKCFALCAGVNSWLTAGVTVAAVVVLCLAIAIGVIFGVKRRRAGPRSPASGASFPAAPTSGSLEIQEGLNDLNTNVLRSWFAKT